MGKDALEGLFTVATVIVGLGIIATLVSKNAQTPQVLTAAGQALGGSIQAAEGPVTTNGGGTTNLLANSSLTSGLFGGPTDTIAI